MSEIVEQEEWHGHRLTRQVTMSEAGKPIPFLTVSPTSLSGSLPCIIAIHGRAGSKEDWLELDAYTKGGNLVKALADNGYAVVAVDLYGHGGNQADTPIDHDDLIDNEWETFFHRSLAIIKMVMKDLVKQGMFDQSRTGFLSYSLGGHFGFWMANRGDSFKTMVMCVPSVDKGHDDEYTTYHNLSNLKAATLLIVGEEDEHIPFKDSKWLFEQLPMRDKQLNSFESGHNLPIEYVPVAVDWFRKWL